MIIWYMCAGLFVGSSSAMNVVGALVTARRMGPGHTVVTVLCDGGYRHMTRYVWSSDHVHVERRAEDVCLL